MLLLNVVLCCVAQTVATLCLFVKLAIHEDATASDYYNAKICARLDAINASSVHVANSKTFPTISKGFHHAHSFLSFGWFDSFFVNVSIRV